MGDERKDLQEGIQAFDCEDYASAFSLLLPLAEAGWAQGYMALMYMGGLGVPPDGPRAVRWFRQMGEQKEQKDKISAVAYHNLGTLYSTGMPSVPVDRRRARECWRRAAELGSELLPKEWYTDTEAE